MTVESCSATENRLAPTVPSDLALLVITDSSESTSSHPQLIDEAATSSPRHPQQINMASTSSHPQLINEAATSSPRHPQQINMERTSPHDEKINEATASPDPQQISISILSNITSVDSLPSPPLTHMWVQSLNLTVYDKLELLQGKWLTDKHINAAIILLKKQFQTQNGLEDPLVLSEKLICTSLSANFVQIINIKRQHWVCASNINCPAGVVDVYDSVPRMSYNCKILQKQLAALAKTIHRELEIRFIDVQHQVDSNDCGLFAIAFAQVLCCKIDPHLTSHSQIDMREHLAQCFEEGEMVPFPAAQKSRRLKRHRMVKLERLHVYCTCRLPWFTKDDIFGDMVQCKSCKEWFHQMCEEIDNSVFLERNRWICKSCGFN